MRLILFFIFLAISCAPLPHVEPRARTTTDAERASVDIYVSCSSPDMSGDSDHPKPNIVWREPNVGRGIMISERHVLTSAHVVRCPDIPSVTVTLYDGRVFRMVVERDEEMFEGKENGVARLVIPSGSTFRAYIAPPALGDSDGLHYMIARKSGTVTGRRFDIAHYFGPGDSGTGVYSPTGLLVGVLWGGSEHEIIISRVDETWLKGT